MHNRGTRLVPALLCCLVFFATTARALWIEDGVPVAETEGGQDHSMIMTDGAGGALVVWQDFRSMTTLKDICMQRLDGSGTPQWTAAGVALCVETADQTSPRFATDGGGGAIVVWHDERGGDMDIYAQRVKASGTIQWAAGGVGICTETGSQSGARIVEDGAGGAFIVWNDRRNATDNETTAAPLRPVPDRKPAHPTHRGDPPGPPSVTSRRGSPARLSALC